MIEKAIKEGFQQYSITEHAPLPRGIIEDEVVEKDFALLANEMESYLSLIGTLKKEYQNHIKVLAGIEIDFFSKFTPRSHFQNLALIGHAAFLAAGVSINLIVKHDGGEFFFAEPAMHQALEANVDQPAITCHNHNVFFLVREAYFQASF